MAVVRQDGRLQSREMGVNRQVESLCGNLEADICLEAAIDLVEQTRGVGECLGFKFAVVA